MFGVVITVFGVCWLPYHLYFLYSYLEPGRALTSYYLHFVYSSLEQGRVFP
jgi:hypothetical protein